MRTNFNIICVLIGGVISLISGCSLTSKNNDWTPIFNGKNLTGWTPKFAGYALGENYLNTFQVRNGSLFVSYDNWTRFDNEFGHLFFHIPYENYDLRATYRFVGEQVKGGAGWAYRNNGLMLHSQPPESMTLDQAFPTSIEVQLLGGNGSDPRPTLNVCTPDTSIVIAGRRDHTHCIDSTSMTYHGDQWVDIEIQVRGNHSVRHFVNGEEVLRYQDVQLDQPLPEHLQALYTSKALSQGYIAIQAESHPTEFKRIEVKPVLFNK